MKMFRPLILLFVCTACAFEQTRISPTIDASRKAILIESAYSELKKHGVDVSAQYDVNVTESEFIGELTPLRPIYVVSFSARKSGRAKLRYAVTIDKATGVVEDFNDYESGIPLR